MSKKRKKKTSKKSFNLKYIIYLLLLIIFSLTAFIIGIVFTQKNYEKEIQKKENTLKVLQEKIKKLEQNNKKTKLKKENYTYIPSEALDFQKSQNSTTFFLPPKKENIAKEKNKIKSKPKLVIIIDDVSFKGQIRKIKAIPYKITPSFFPPTNRHPNTPIYAKEFSHYMVHLPMEAIHFNKPEPKTLNTTDTYKTILNRVIEVKHYFPNAKFINNHTGSTFTSDKQSMIKLFKALEKEHLGFVDSKTTPNSKSKIAKKYYNIPLYSRNIFLDNIENSKYIKKQLQKAINIAKKRGYAIAIGHPHPITLETLKNSKNLLKNIEVVYIDELSKN